MNEQKTVKNDEEKGKKPLNYFMLIDLGLEFAFILLIPLLVLIYIGKWLDAKYGVKYFVIIGILLALTLSWYMIFKKINDVRKMLK